MSESKPTKLKETSKENKPNIKGGSTVGMGLDSLHITIPKNYIDTLKKK
ncbi:hypothetical protein I2F27_12575 [Acinetobacter sp. B5B]|nr:hypothetical protein [Acinetobacter baretiae]MBF7684124.1 hypothetical protein [Acinetobacter baretiae]